MAVHMTESLPRTIYPWSDPDAFLACDNAACDAAWVAGAGLVSWRIARETPRDSFWSETFVVGCTLDCLHAAQRARGNRQTAWSEPMPIADWLDALRSSLELDPRTTPIGEMLPLP